VLVFRILGFYNLFNLVMLQYYCFESGFVLQFVIIRFVVA